MRQALPKDTSSLGVVKAGPAYSHRRPAHYVPSSSSALFTVWLTTSSERVSRRRYAPDLASATRAMLPSFAGPSTSLCHLYLELGACKLQKRRRETPSSPVCKRRATHRRLEIECLVRVACSENGAIQARRLRLHSNIGIPQSPSPLPIQPPCPQNPTQRILPHRRTVTPREALRGACSGNQKGKEPGSSSSCGMLPHQDTALALVDNTVGPSSSPLASLPPRIICSVPGIKTTSNKYIADSTY
ncbi:hypothetical protein B0H16DRAFT_1752928 [Mycena metata]|uniref:Uncharacterized protein n=1 Tax=Mycena metata TaxID=1033252 RepID=A0AAD7GDC9_9AGAR|nr:hypothetical protein B0H16DRAFT_1752928 [Mycena metata]